MIETRNYRSEEGYVLPYLSFSSYEALPYIRHMFTTREGGVSKDIYESLNLSFTRGDDETAVLENYRRVAQALGTSIDHIVTSDQTHTTNVRPVGKEDLGKGITRPRDYKDVDGMITDQPGVLLATFYADCVPLYFVDPVHKAIGLSHSGWRGTVGRMGQATVEAMERSFGSQPKDLLCAIGPSICQDCYEVSRDVAEAFIAQMMHAIRPGSRILTLGTEECMYPALMLGKVLEQQGMDGGVRCHATTRSPIGICTQEGYPIFSGSKILGTSNSG